MKTELPVDFISAARRHYKDACLLLTEGRNANAGQLLGFSIECGLKALLLACGVKADAEGDIPSGKFRQHLPTLSERISAIDEATPDGRKTQSYMAKIPSLNHFSDWRIHHRYYRESEIPLTSLPAWERAAKEMNKLLDQIQLAEEM